MADDAEVLERTEPAPPAETPAETPPVSDNAGRNTAADAPKADPPGGVLDAAGADEPPGDTSAALPENWRMLLAGKNEKGAALLGRYESGEKFVDAHMALLAKMSSGDHAARPPDTDADALAAWREKRGIPATPDDYVLPEIEGKAWTERDKPIIEAFLAFAHAGDLPQERVSEAIQNVYDSFGAVAEMQAESDRAYVTESVDALREAWGADFRGNINLTKRLLGDQKPIADALLGSRDAQGRRLVDNPEIVQWLAGIARDRYGSEGMISGEEAATISSRIDEIKNILRTDSSRYYREKNGKGQSLADELLELQRRAAGSKT